ncbi:MAG: prepilin-type N-terminal cleavage/methylation domain-containing protein [Puniceicoccales bacterium]|jgi:prepilin-type N-terminal cleavage/methylation domain-containing protein|nr:prepilin-type N-terminal cleavage/methylation domain-containing protein [Puniceicoccales bacterium]
MQDELTSGRRGFTLLETLLSLFLIAFISALSFYLFTSISKRHKPSLENAAVDRELHALTEVISEDLSCIILINKGFSAFEFKSDREQQKFFISFFSSNNEEHVTKSIQYCVRANGDSSKSFIKSELSAADSLLMQSTLDEQSSLHENFLKYVPSATRILGCKLLDFSVRVAVQVPSGGIFISPTNASLTYKNGCLYYKKAGAITYIKGTPLFIDIVARALTNTTEQELSSTNFKSKRERALFLASEVRKSFRRIMVKSRFF